MCLTQKRFAYGGTGKMEDLVADIRRNCTVEGCKGIAVRYGYVYRGRFLDLCTRCALANRGADSEAVVTTVEDFKGLVTFFEQPHLASHFAGVAGVCLVEAVQRHECDGHKHGFTWTGHNGAIHAGQMCGVVALAIGYTKPVGIESYETILDAELAVNIARANKKAPRLIRDAFIQLVHAESDDGTPIGKCLIGTKIEHDCGDISRAVAFLDSEGTPHAGQVCNLGHVVAQTVPGIRCFESISVARAYVHAIAQGIIKPEVIEEIDLNAIGEEIIAGPDIVPVMRWNDLGLIEKKPKLYAGVTPGDLAALPVKGQRPRDQFGDVVKDEPKFVAQREPKRPITLMRSGAGPRIVAPVPLERKPRKKDKKGFAEFDKGPALSSEDIDIARQFGVTVRLADQDAPDRGLGTMSLAPRRPKAPIKRMEATPAPKPTAPKPVEAPSLLGAAFDAAWTDEEVTPV